MRNSESTGYSLNICYNVSLNERILSWRYSRMLYLFFKEIYVVEIRLDCLTEGILTNIQNNFLCAHVCKKKNSLPIVLLHACILYSGISFSTVIFLEQMMSLIRRVLCTMILQGSLSVSEACAYRNVNVICFFTLRYNLLVS